MGKFKVLERSFINNSLVEAGEIVDYDGLPSSNLEPIDKAAKASAKEAAAVSSEEKEARQNLSANEARPDLPAPDPEKLQALSDAANAPDLPKVEGVELA